MVYWGGEDLWIANKTCDKKVAGLNPGRGEIHSVICTCGLVRNPSFLSIEYVVRIYLVRDFGINKFALTGKR